MLSTSLPLMAMYVGMIFQHIFEVSRNPKVGDKTYFTVELENRGNVLLVLIDEIEITFTSAGIDTMLTLASSGGKQQINQHILFIWAG